jgi:hypothetical protein
MGQKQTKFLYCLQLTDYDFINNPNNAKRLKGLKLLKQVTPNGGEITIAIYLVVTSDLFKDPFEPGITTEERTERSLIMEMRGAIFDRKTGKCIRRPFHKFENIGSLFTIETINWSDVVILEKLDGSLIAPYIYNGLIIWATKKGHNPDVDEYVANSFDKRYVQLVNDWTGVFGYSCMFEWCSPKNKIILKYTESSLTLIGMRNIETGEYMTYDKLVHIASNYKVPVVKQYINDVGNPKKFVADLYEQKGIEGCVVTQRSTGAPVCKIKCTEYSRISKDSNYIGHSSTIPWENTINETWDDISRHLEAGLQVKMLAFRDAVVTALQAKADEIQQTVLAIKAEIGEPTDSLDKTKNREFYEKVSKYGPTREIYFNVRKNPTEDPFDILMAFAKKNLKNTSLLEELTGVHLNDFKTDLFKE